MPRALISLYVLLTTPVTVPRLLLAKAAAVVLAYALVRPWAPGIGIGAVNIAVLAGLLVIVFHKLPFQMKSRGNMSGSAGTVVVLVVGLCAVVLYTPAVLLPYAISAGSALMAVIYGAALRWDRPMLDQLGWPRDDWGVGGQTNAVRWSILRCVGLSVTNAYAATFGTQAEWVVSYAALPVVFYYLFQWTVIATHPYDDA